MGFDRYGKSSFWVRLFRYSGGLTFHLEYSRQLHGVQTTLDQQSIEIYIEKSILRYSVLEMSPQLFYFLSVWTRICPVLPGDMNYILFAGTRFDDE